MKRREFITLIGGAAAAWPLAAGAQKVERMKGVGVLMGYAESNSEGQTFVAAFREGLLKLGWTEGRDLRSDYRWAPPGDAETSTSRRLPRTTDCRLHDRRAFRLRICG